MGGLLFAVGAATAAVVPAGLAEFGLADGAGEQLPRLVAVLALAFLTHTTGCIVVVAAGEVQAPLNRAICATRSAECVPVKLAPV